MTHETRTPEEVPSSAEYIRIRRQRREGLREAERRKTRKTLLLVLVSLITVAVVLKTSGTLSRAAAGGAGRMGAASMDAIRAGFESAATRLAFWRNGPVKVRLRTLAPAVDYGKQIGVMGMVTPPDLGGARVAIEERRDDGKWMVMTKVPVSAKGVFESKVTPRFDGVLRARIGDRGMSRAVRVEVRPVVSLKAPETAFWRRPMRIEGTVAPAKAGMAVLVQVRARAGWAKLREARTNEAGRYVLNLRPKKAGTQSYRAIAADKDGLPQAASRPVKTHVWYMVALTFDDGPVEPYTAEILGTLRRLGVKGNFFVLGQMAEEYPALVRRAVREGHVVGNHSYDHKTLTRLSEENLVEELKSTSDLIAKISGKRPRWMRPPGGATNEEVNATSRRLGMKVAIWDITTVDWMGGPTFHTVTRRVMEQVKPFDMVLMHDGGGDRSQTAKAVKGIVQRLKAKDYLPVTLDRIYPGTSAPEPLLPAEREPTSTIR